jgi:large subunit ribosomal protein L25
VYGKGAENRSIEVDTVAFRKTFGKAGESTLIDLSIDGGAPVKVLVHDLQVDPLKSTVSHVDFLQVNMKEELEVQIAIKFVGESMAIKGMGGTLVKNKDHVTVRCLPSDLVHEIVVDISALATFDDVIRVSSLTLPAGLRVMDDGADAIALVEAPRSEEELKALDEKVTASVDAVEVVKKEKKDDEAETPAA